MDMMMFLKPNGNGIVGGNNPAFGQGLNGASGSKAESALFSQMLQSQFSDSTEQSISLSGAWPAGISMMPQSLELLMQGLQADENEEQSMLLQLIDALGRDPQFAQSLLEDSNVQQWMDEAMAVLNAMNASFGQIALPQQLTAQTDMASGSEANVIDLQRTLLMLSSMTAQKGDHPVTQHLLTQLQTALEPHLQQFSAVLQGKLPVVQSGEDALVSAGPNAGSAKALSGSEANTAVHSAKDVSTNGNGMAAITVHDSGSKLDMLAARSSLKFAAISHVSTETGTAEQATAPEMIVSAVPNDQIQAGFRQQPLIADSAKSPMPSMNAENFAEDMSQFVVKSLKVSLMSGGISEAKISLKPENLGHVDVKITMQNGQLVAHIATQTFAAKEILESQLPQLRMMLQNQGLQVEKLEVTQNSETHSSMFHDHGQRQQSFEQEQFTRRQAANPDKYGIEEAKELQDHAEMNDELLVDGLRSSSFDASA